MATARRTKAVKAAEPEIEEPTVEIDEEEDFDIEEEEVAPAPKKKTAKKAAAEKPAKAAAPKIEFGTKELADHVNKETGSSFDAYNLRILLRKLTKEGVLERVESEGRARYSFSGPKDPQVVAIVAAVKDGAVEKAKTERLETLKANRKPKAKKTAAKKADVEPEADEEDDFDVDEI